uniref:Si:dkey-33c9.6 n=1 Tax=Pundamilia nyererei TaxID=303518 RepID=A0A3B4FI65_9CICH
TTCSKEEMLERRLTVLKGILESEEVYLRELDTLLMPMKALRASAGTSQPVLSSQQVQTVFYQVPELRDVHQTFYSGLKARLSAYDVSQIGLYGGFIENYVKAVEVVRKCTHSDPRFRTLAESMMSNNGTDKARTTYTFELLYKPLDRVTKTTLVLQDLLKTTPTEHRDYTALQEALRLSRSFLSGVNESSQSKREVTLSRGMRRQLMRDGFVVDVSESERSLRHLFLYTDLLLCTRFKHAKQDQYRFCWYLPLAGLRLHWVADKERPPETNVRLHSIRTKMYVLRQQLLQQLRQNPKLEQMELMLLTHLIAYRLELHSPSGKFIETVPPDLLTLTSSCVKLRMTQQPPLHMYVCVEVDGFKFYDQQTQTHSSVLSLNPHWDQLDSKTLNKRWKKQTLQLGQVELTLSLKYCPHPLGPPSSTVQQPPIFGVPIETVALSLLQSCPDANRHTFLYLLHHLQISERQHINKMSLLNLATVFGPSLLRPPVAGQGHHGPTVDISQEVVVQ